MQGGEGQRRRARNQCAQGSQHGPARVQELQLKVAVECGRLARQRERVKAVVSRRLAAQPGRVVRLQRAQELWPLGAIPGAARRVRS